MRYLLQRLSPGLACIAAAAVILLAMDRGHGARPAEGRLRVDVFYIVSSPSMDGLVRGVLEGMAEGGFVDGRNIAVRRYCPEGDGAVAAAISRTIVTERPRLAVTVATPCMQALANANTATRVPHVFCAVTDPWGAGVGVTTTTHPPYMTGFGLGLQVREAFTIARQMYPGLRTLGTVYNPSEPPARFALQRARPLCDEMGLRLVESSADNPTNVLDGVRSVIARGAQALWIGPDNTVDVCAGAMVQIARDAGVPVIGSVLPHVRNGCLFALGADEVETGRIGGRIAARVLRGESTASIPVTEQAPIVFALNPGALTGLRDPWRIPADLRARATLVAPTQARRR